MTLTTACDTGAGSLPTDYVEVPAINEANGGKDLWALPPSDDVGGNCANGEVLDPRCWDALDMDDYVKWWWGAFQHDCDGKTGFAQCFYIASTSLSPADCSNFGTPCGYPSWGSFKGTWNDVRNFYVAVSDFILIPVSYCAY
jgi:hypothetical protein